MLMALDQFVFGLSTFAYQQLQRQTQWKHRGSSRVGARDANQFMGPGEDTITLRGIVAPDVTGDLASIEKLRTMGNTGDAYALVDGAGQVYGAFYIDSMTEDQTQHYPDGTPRRVDFSITLKRADDNQATTSRAGPIADNSDGSGSDFGAYA